MNDPRFEDLCDRFEASWRDCQPLRIETLLAELPSSDQGRLLRALLEIEMEYRLQSNQPPTQEEYEARFLRQPKIVANAFASARKRLRSSLQKDLAETLVKSNDDVNSGGEDDPTQIGQYKILRPLGHGGMGQVYLAEQTEPVIRRVAVKVIKTDAPTKEILARFEAERQAFAMMEHHHIAKVFDAGVTDSGRPYFVMEWVKGMPITDHCDKYKLSPNERLELFVQTCRAIQHAHAKGIVHRDIKPSNVLVTLDDGKPTVKVIDFGLAKALHETTRLTDRTLFTQYGQVVGTLAYMSPEQAELNTLDIDTRTDVYSLGVVLYELLTGSTPITSDEIKSNAFDRILALIREADPPRPSDRLSDSGVCIKGISYQRQTAPRRLSMILRGDLDWIAMKALEKDRNRRYDTPAAMADDVQRFLNSEAIEARPPSLSYQLQKSFRKHQARYIAASTILGLLIAGLAGTGTMWYRASSAEATARTETSKANDALGKLNDALIDVEQERDRANANKALAEQKADEAEDSAEKARELAEEKESEAATANFQLANARWDAGQAEQARRILHEIPDKYRDNFEWHYCNRKFLGSDLTFYGHLREINSIDFSPDGKHLASSGREGWVKFWNAETGQDIATLKGHRNIERGHLDVVFAVCFSPDGQYIATGGADNLIKIWDAKTRKELRTLSGHTDDIYKLCFSPDGKRIASASKDGTLRFWKPTGGPPLHVVKHYMPILNPYAMCNDLSFSPDSQKLASASFGGAVSIWDVNRGKEERRVYRFQSPDQPTGTVSSSTAPGRTIGGLCISPDGKLIAVGYRDGTIQLWDIPSWKKQRAIKGFQGSGEIKFSPDGTRIAAGDRVSNTIKVWDVSSGLELASLTGHSSSVHGISFSPDSSKLASASGDGTLKLWDLTEFGNFVTSRVHQKEIVSLSFSPNDQQIATASYDGTIKVLDVNTLKEIQTLKEKKVSHTGACFSPDWKRFATNGSFDAAMLWDTETGELLHLLRRPFELPEGQKGTGVRGVGSVCFNSDASRIALGYQDGSVSFWNAHTGQLLWLSKGHSKWVRSICLNQKGTMLASADVWGTIKLWDVETGKEHKMFRHVGMVQSLQFSPDDLYVASAGMDMRLWKVATGKVVHVMKGHRTVIDSLHFNQDGTRIVTGGHDGTVRLWNASTGKEISTLTQDAPSYHSVRFSSDGKRIIAGSADGTIKQWSAYPTNEIRRLEGHTEDTRIASFSADGSTLASACNGGIINLWDLKSGKMHRSLKGHTEPVFAAGFSDDGSRLYSQTPNEKFVWDTATGQILSDQTWVEVRSSTRHGDLRARVSGNSVLLVDQNWKHMESEMSFRMAKAQPKPWWHRAQLQASMDAKAWYAASFHAAWLLKRNPNSQEAYSWFHEAFEQLDKAHLGALPVVIQTAAELPKPEVSVSQPAASGNDASPNPN